MLQVHMATRVKAGTESRSACLQACSPSLTAVLPISGGEGGETRSCRGDLSPVAFKAQGPAGRASPQNQVEWKVPRADTLTQRQEFRVPHPAQCGTSRRLMEMPSGCDSLQSLHARVPLLLTHASQWLWERCPRKKHCPHAKAWSLAASASKSQCRGNQIFKGER